jgi:DNA-binding NarL/FixJ family response regulator
MVNDEKYAHAFKALRSRLVPGKDLSAAQYQTVRAVLRGLSDKEIAFDFGITPNGVRLSLVRIFKALNIHSRVELLLWANRPRLVEYEDT